MEILKLENVSKTYGKKRLLVKAVRKADLKLRKGEITLIMGPSGSGKTTLLSIAGGLLKPTHGKVFFKGKMINKLSHRELAKFRLNNTGFVFQTFNLLSSLSAIENVEAVLNLGRIKGVKAKNRAKKILMKVNMGHRINFHPNTLSSGEMQRVAIARALVNDPDIILADEPTGNLDKKSGKNVMKLFKKLVKNEGKCAIVVTHDERILDIADKVLWLEDGKLSRKRNPRLKRK